MKIRDKTVIVLIAFVTFVLVVTVGYNFTQKSYDDYGVFIGADSDSLETVSKYNIVVIDADFITYREIARLHTLDNKKVFSYLNVGSLETFRDIHSEMFDITLDNYENWEEEKWVDVTQDKWVSYILDKAEEYQQMGANGLFLDNFDVYYKYPTDEVYNSLVYILEELSKIDIPIIINGADEFIKRAMVQEDLNKLVFGVNQEGVFTSVNFDDGSFGVNDPSDKKYFQDYLQQCKKYGLTVFLLEYVTDNNIKKDIEKYCNKNKFHYYFADSLELK